MYESFFVENVTFLAVSQKKFSEEFHEDARCQNTVHQEVERLKAKIQQLDNAKTPSTAGYLLRENHTLKSRDNTVIKMNLNRIEEVEKSSQQSEEKVKIDLELNQLLSAMEKLKVAEKPSGVSQVRRGCHF